MDGQQVGTTQSHPYTCISCNLAFTDASNQRQHYQSDLHRYNAKRRVAGLGPVSNDLFNDKVKERSGKGELEEEDEDENEQDKKLACKTCNKTFATTATQANHMLSKKHKEAVFKAINRLKPSDLSGSASPPTSDVTMKAADPIPSTSTAAPIDSTKFESSGDPKLDLLVARRLLSSPPISPLSCLFCPPSHAHPQAKSVAENVAHMRQFHSFVIPEEEYLVDLEGLLRRLGEEVGTWNVCVFCGKGYGGNINLDEEAEGGKELTEEERRKKASRGVEAVRSHMISKSHCKIPYETENQRMDLADFYDFRPSYPDYLSRKERKAAKKAAQQQAEGWEDVDGDGDGDETMDDGDEVEVIMEEESDSDASDSDDDLDSDEASSGITYGDSSYELVLPSGRRIGHKSHSHLHKQHLLPYLSSPTGPFKAPPHASQATPKAPSAHSLALLSLVPSSSLMRKDKTHSRPLHQHGLVPARGAGFGKGNGEVVKARNKGEAKWAGKATREFRELKERSRQEFVRGVKANSQEHYRDHLLQ